MADFTTGVIVGADTHKDFHTVAVISKTGQEISSREFEVSTKGYREALAWVATYGTVLRAGVESTGSYGAGLCAYLQSLKIEVYDVYAPDKKRRRRSGKDDGIDAFQAAQAALSYTRCALAKDRCEVIDCALHLESAYKLAIRQRTATINALKALVVKLPDTLRSQLEQKTTAQLIKTCANFRIGTKTAECEQGTKIALRHYARQIRSFDAEILVLDKQIQRYAEVFVPSTIDLLGVGHHGAITLLGVSGANIDRLKSEAAFSMLCGTSPIPASSGNKHHHRLNRGGNRKANCALHIMALTRIRMCQKTQAYIAKKLSEGKSTKDSIRALKRYLAREVYGVLKADLTLLGLIS